MECQNLLLLLIEHRHSELDLSAKVSFFNLINYDNNTAIRFMPMLDCMWTNVCGCVRACINICKRD